MSNRIDLNSAIWNTFRDDGMPKSKYPCVLLFSEDFIDEDFNPTGIVDGYWQDDEGWVIWQWNNCQDCYDTVRGAQPTHWAYKEILMPRT